MDNLQQIKNLKNLIDLYSLYVKYKKIQKAAKKRKPAPSKQKSKSLTPAPITINNGIGIEEMCDDGVYKKVRARRRNVRRNLMKGYYEKTFLEIKEKDPQAFFKATRMTKELFESLLVCLQPYLVKHSMREPVSPEHRLALTLMWLVHGTDKNTMAKDWQLGRGTVRKILYETCDALWNVLAPKYVTEPSVADLEAITDDFWNTWGVPNCLGAIAGKHILIARPRVNAAEYTIRRRTYGIVLLAACNAKHSFTYVDIGAYGSETKTGVFQSSAFGKRLLEDNMMLPASKYLPGSFKTLPPFFVADDSIPLHTHIMKAYPAAENLAATASCFNERISCGQQVIENTFGILVARWQSLLTELNMMPENAAKVALACVALHNFITAEQRDTYIPTRYADWLDDTGTLREGLWRKEVSNNLHPIPPCRTRPVYNKNLSTHYRGQLCLFFNNEGKLNARNTIL